MAMGQVHSAQVKVGISKIKVGDYLVKKVMRLFMKLEIKLDSIAVKVSS
jgi:hypothetical protein